MSGGRSLLVVLSFAASVRATSGNGPKNDADKQGSEAGTAEASARSAPSAVTMSPDALREAGVVTAKVARTELTPKDEMPGTVEAPRDALVVVNARAPGVVERLDVDVGDVVKAGQEVAMIRSSELSQAEADHRRAVASEQHAREGSKRTEALEEQGLLSPKRRADDKFAWEQSRLAIDEASERIRILGGTVGDSKGTITVTSPISGTVSARNASRGETVAENGPLFSVIDLSRLVVELRSPTGASVEPGAKVTFTVEGLGGKTFEATVKSTGAVLDPETRKFSVRCTLNGSEKALKPGMFVSASVPRTPIRALSVPENAILMMGGKPWVFVTTGPARFEKRAVTLGERVDGLVVIDKGLAEGEELAIEGAFWLRSELQKSELEE